MLRNLFLVVSTLICFINIHLLAYFIVYLNYSYQTDAELSEDDEPQDEGPEDFSSNDDMSDSEPLTDHTHMGRSRKLRSNMPRKFATVGIFNNIYINLF